MSEKQRRSVSLDPPVDQYLRQDGVNASELVNTLVENHMSAGGDEVSMLKLREQQLRSEISELESRLDTKQEELDTVQDQLADHRDDREALLEEAAETLPAEVRHEENPAIQTWAQKCDMPVSEFLDRLNDHNGT